MKAISIGILASFFFASTFVFNRAMDLSGGSWIWSASLRYFFSLPFLLLLVIQRHNMKALWEEMKSRPLTWLIWSTIGFGLFYAPICFAAAYGSAWLVAGTWQITIVAGSFLVPFFYDELKTAQGVEKRRQRIPKKEIFTSLFILLGVGLIQNSGNEQVDDLEKLIIGIVPVVIAAFAYPLGNRKMMFVCKGRLDVYQRVLGMTIASMPFWLFLGLYGTVTVGLPSSWQVIQSLIVGIASGVIATVLFFMATDMAKGNPKKLSVVEATQAGEVVFAVAGEILFLGGTMPVGWSLAGIFIIIVGMILHSFNIGKA
jgi:drug/metabolite transporter (DMT)-like permease